jgi:hypothetical protein
MAKRHKNLILVQGPNVDHGGGMKVVPSRAAVRIEHPGDGETIAGTSYTFQIGTAKDVDGAEVSIDGGAWLPCRESLGLWWYDWSGFDAGAHELLARTRMVDGLTFDSAPRRFTVE